MIICKYKFDSSIYNNLIPEFNSGYTGYAVSDTVDGNIVTRTIECDVLPTLMSFGQVYVSGEVQQDYTRCLLEVLDMNTSELTNCSNMFRYCTNLTSINCNWNTSKVTNMEAMFLHCLILTKIEGVSNFDTSNVNNMRNMFYNCNKLTSLDLSNFDTSKVIDMESMFRSCKSLTQLDVSNFDTSNITNMRYMFQECSNLVSIDMKNSDYNSVNKIIAQLPTRTTDSIGTLDITGIDDISQVNIGAAQAKFWNILNEDNSYFVLGKSKLGQTKLN